MSRFHPGWLLLVLLAPLPASAGEAEHMCALAVERMGNFAGALEHWQAGSFDDEGRHYRGCIATIIGDGRNLQDQTPRSETLYPMSGSELARAGWLADREADGPDGTAYRIRKGKTFCLIDGWWDGGDDADPSNQPSPLFQLTVRCSDEGTPRSAASP
jgi:hypothetical protein